MIFIYQGIPLRKFNVTPLTNKNTQPTIVISKYPFNLLKLYYSLTAYVYPIITNNIDIIKIILAIAIPIYLYCYILLNNK